LKMDSFSSDKLFRVDSVDKNPSGSRTLQSEILSSFIYYPYVCFRRYRAMASEEIIEINKRPQPVFKNRSFQQKFRQTSTTGKKRTWRSLKQVLAQERSLPWPTTVKHCMRRV